MEGIAKRDVGALAALYDRYAPAVLALCARILGRRDEAEDLVSEIFFEIWRRAGRYDPHRASPSVYLMTLARSRAIDRWRFLQRRIGVWGEASDPDAAVSLGQRPLARVIENEHRDRLRDALDTLVPGERDAVELSFFHGLTHREIAERLDQPLGTVKTRVRRGLLRLRDQLERVAIADAQDRGKES